MKDVYLYPLRRDYKRVLTEPGRGVVAIRRVQASYNQKLWILDLTKGATYPPS